MEEAGPRKDQPSGEKVGRECGPRGLLRRTGDGVWGPGGLERGCGPVPARPAQVRPGSAGTFCAPRSYALGVSATLGTCLFVGV